MEEWRGGGVELYQTNIRDRVVDNPLESSRSVRIGFNPRVE